MNLTSVERFILFALGEFYKQANKKLTDKPLQLALTKVEFITIARKMNLAPKKERALYKNLEALETKKFISYQERNLMLTNKGHKSFQQISGQITPFINIKLILGEENPINHARKAQTVFSEI